MCVVNRVYYNYITVFLVFNLHVSGLWKLNKYVASVILVNEDNLVIT